jgi:hypothetical protein
MEVHAHSHTPRKKWTHYFWEFLMLFLAVFCGFLAEYQLEHKIEKDREKQFIISLEKDLTDDTIILKSQSNLYKANVERLDSFLHLLCVENIKGHEGELYYLARRASRGDVLALHDRTIQQMKNSGAFRLIRKESVSKAIIEYYNQLSFYDLLLKVELSEAEEYRKQVTYIFHPEIMDNLVNEMNEIEKPDGNPALLTYDKITLLRLAGMVSYIKNTRLGIAKREMEMYDTAKSLIELLKKEYHLK